MAWYEKASDNFTRADESPLGGAWSALWATDGGVSLAGNRVGPSTLASYISSLHSATLGDDQYAQFTLDPTSTINYEMLFIRANAVSGGNGYFLETDSTANTTYYIGKLTNGTVSTLASLTGMQSRVTYPTMRITAIGATICLDYLDGTTWVAFATVSDGTHASGGAGVGGYRYSSGLAYYISGFACGDRIAPTLPPFDDTDWGYRKSITVSRATGAVTDYQMKLLVGESAGATGEDVDCGGFCNADFSDLRFTAADGTTQLDYWIESVSGTTPNQLATVWVEFDSIGTGATTFYMYYGNSGASPASDGDRTFLFFDGFDGSLTDRWTGTAGFTNSGGICTGLHSGANRTMSARFGFDADTLWRTRMKSAHVADGGPYCESFGFTNLSGTTAYYRAYFSYTGNQHHYTQYYGDWSTGVDIAGWTTPDTFYILTAKRNGITSVINSVDDANEVTVFDHTPLGVMGANIDVLFDAAASVALDWIFCGQYLATGPAFGSWGSEEALHATATFVLQDVNANADDDYMDVGGSGMCYIGTSFVAGSDYALTRVQLKLWRGGTVSSTFNCRIFTDAGGYPGTLLGDALAVVDGNTFAGNPGDMIAPTWDFAPISLTMGTKYWICVGANGPGYAKIRYTYGVSGFDMRYSSISTGDAGTYGAYVPGQAPFMTYSSGGGGAPGGAVMNSHFFVILLAGGGR